MDGAKRDGADAIGAALLGGLGAMMTPVASASASGFGLLIIGVLLLLVLVELRRFRQTAAAGDSVRQLMLKTAPLSRSSTCMAL
ncbi:enterobactin exporter EntS [Escherichia coli]|uniref:Enterobactin exporter EntS n=1 Tax=Escherichia coli TaxID=562 RepID=A0A376VZ01_ECOLX|nr:enterobactin exporter EntS [Escherichia coli]